MSSLQQVVSSIQSNDYLSLVIVTAVGYDFILTLSDEIEYIWKKRWTWVSTLFVLIRYIGLYDVVINAFEGSSLFPGPANLNSCNTLEIIAMWTNLIFIGAADMTMILRVYAIYSASRPILGILLALYAFEIIMYLISNIDLSLPNKLTQATVEVVNLSFCAVTSAPGPLIYAKLLNGVQIALGGLMFLLVVIRFTREMVQKGKSTQSFRLSRYTYLLFKEGMIYFLVTVAFALINVLSATGQLSTNGWRIFPIGIFNSIPPYTLSVRFILNLRKLYARETRGQLEGEIDTAFGFTSFSGNGPAVMSAIMFGANDQNDEQEQIEEIAMEESEIRGGA